jgi:PAS domain S-box-containing protein
MDDREIRDIETSGDIGRFTESYSSFSKIVNKLQRQYISLKETYIQQSEELQAVNKTLQSLMSENRAVTEFLNSILNSLSSGVIAVDRSGRISHMNPVARRILGLDEPKDNIPRQCYDEIIKAAGNPSCSAMETIRTGETFENEEKKVETLYGTTVTLSVSTSLLRNRGGEIVGAVELFRDVSKIKRMEEQLSRMKVLASLGEMAASIAHEVRNPLVGIGGFASLLARDLSDDPSKREMAKKIVEGVESINSTVQTLLDFARREKVQKSTVDLNTYLGIILDDFADECGEDDLKARINRVFASETNMRVDLDRQLFKQAIYNLMKNGLEAGGKESGITIATSRLPLAKAQRDYANRLELSGTETLAEIVIEDNGSGIAKDDIDKLFSPFYSTKENGIGLGLSIAWKIIKAHGGDISAVSEEGRGTRFSVVLPLKTG